MTDPLTDELGDGLPGGFDALDDAARERFAAAIREARVRRRRDINAAIDASLRMLPHMLRPPVRKVLGV